MYLALLVSNALFFHVLTVWAAKRWFRASYANFACRRTRNRVGAALAWPIGFMALLLSGFPRPLQLLLIKDWRLLRRDPVQWSQFLIFFGLLGLYFLNVDRFNNPHSDIGYVTWINMVSFLNLAVVGLILSTFTTRFIYPMISLEGHCFWILGLLPIERDTILWSKFWFASIGSWIPCAVLVLLSDVMLDVPLLVIGVHQLTCVLLVLGVGLDRRGFRRDDAEFSRNVALENRGRLRRHAQPGAQRALHHGRRRAHRPALPLLLARRQRPVGRRLRRSAISQIVAGRWHRRGDRRRRHRHDRPPPPRPARVPEA